MTGAQLAILRCEIERVRRMAAADGVELVMPPPAPTVDTILDAAFQAGAYVETQWELATLRAHGTYLQFNLVYDRLQAFLNDPTAGSLDASGLAFAGLFGAAAARRGIPDPCGYTVAFPGLNPPDPVIALETVDPSNVETPDAPPAPPPAGRPFYAEPVVWALGLGAAAVGVYLSFARSR